MSKRPWLSFGFFVPMLAALLLVIAVSCGGGATSTAAPQPESVAPAAEPAAEPEAMEEKEAEEAPQVHLAPTATPVPLAEVTATAVPEVVTTGAELYGTLNVAEPVLGRFSGHTRYGQSGQLSTTAEVHEGLLRVDFDSQFEPIMVEDWSIAPDNRVWTFNLKKGIRFHQGWGEVTPEDIINSVRELGADDGSCGCAQILGMFDNPDGYFIGLDNYTLELDTGQPSWEVLRWLQTPGNSHVFSKKQFDKLLETQSQDEATGQLVGTGPFEMVEAKAGEFWRMKAVPDHYRKVPEFAELKFVDIPEESTRIANFLTGKIDVWRAEQDSIAIVAENSDTKFMSQGGAGTMYLLFWQNGYEYVGTDKQWPGYDPDVPWTSSDPDLDSEGWEQARKVREAISLAVDRQKIIDELMGGDGETGAIYGWQPFKSQWPAGFEWDYDVDRAKQLMKDAGYEDGFDLRLTPADGTATATLTLTACQAIADMLGDINIRATVDTPSASVLYAAFKDRTATGITCQAISGFGGAEPLFFHRWSYDPEGVWGLGWDHSWFTERVKTAYETFETDERWSLQLEMAHWMRDNALAATVYGINGVYPLGPKLDSWEEHLSMSRASRISSLEYAIHRR